MKLIFTGYARQLEGDLRELGFDGTLNFADCAATLLPWDEALEKPFRIVFAGPAAGTISSTRLGETLGEGNLLCCDVGGTSTDVSLVVDGPDAIGTALAGFGWSALLSTLYTVVGASLVGYTIFNRLVARYPASSVVPFILLVPPVGMLSAWLALDEVPNPVETVGAVVMLVGVAVAVTTSRRPAPVPVVPASG